MLPNFLIIGAMKAGTTSLHHYLSSHPKIHMSEKKELHFFSQNYDRDLEWYKSQFSPTDIDCICGEASPSYSKFHEYPGVPARIFNILGKDVKFIYLVKNPVDRAISQLKHRHAAGLSNRDWIEELSGNNFQNKFVEAGKYGQQLNHYLEFFDIDQFLIVESTDLQRNRAMTMNTICKFLGVSDDGISDKDLQVSLHQSDDKVEFNRVAYTLSKRFTLGRPTRFTKHWYLKWLLLQPMPTVKLNSNIHQTLQNIFIEDIAMLEDLIGRKLESLSMNSKYLVKD